MKGKILEKILTKDLAPICSDQLSEVPPEILGRAEELPEIYTIDELKLSINEI